MAVNPIIENPKSVRTTLRGGAKLEPNWFETPNMKRLGTSNAQKRLEDSETVKCPSKSS
jgi:hypothetical protein